MGVHPADPLAMQAVCLDKRNDIGVRKAGKAMEKVVRLQKLLAATVVSDQKFSVDKVVSGRSTKREQTVQFSRVGGTIREEAYPHGGIHKNHQATLFFTAACALLLGTSVAPFSLPLSLRSRWYAA